MRFDIADPEHLSMKSLGGEEMPDISDGIGILVENLGVATGGSEMVNEVSRKSENS